MEIKYLQILEMVGFADRLKQRAAHPAVIIHGTAAVHQEQYLYGVFALAGSVQAAFPYSATAGSARAGYALAAKAASGGHFRSGARPSVPYP